MLKSYGRAVLVAELICQVGAQQLEAQRSAGASRLTELVRSIRRDIGDSQEATDIRRYAPPEVIEAHRSAEGSFHENVVRSRPEGWS